MSKAIRDYGRLSLLAFLIGMVTTRLGLVIHEFVGHAATAALVGSDITGYHLFWFGGGYVGYSRAEPFSLGEGLFVALGGLVLEIVLGIVCLLWARKLRRGSIAHMGVLGFGVGHLVHSLHYLAGGTFHGYGDPWILYRELGGNRVFVACALASIMCVLGFVLARHMAGVLRGLLGRHGTRAQLLIVIGAVVTAGAALAALAFGEQALTPNKSYKATFKSVSQRKVDYGVRRYRVLVKRKRGTAPSKAELAKVRRSLKRKHKTFPFMPVISVCLVLSVLAGVVLARPRVVDDAAMPSLPSQRWLAAVAGASLAVVGVLRLFSV